MEKLIVAWLILRIVYALIFLVPIYGLIKNWNDAVNATKLLCPWYPQTFTMASILMLLIGGLSVALGVWTQIVAIGLVAFCLGGYIIHMRLANQIVELGKGSHAKNIDVIVKLGVLGNKTSGQKNLVLAAVGIFFVLVGSGPWSLWNVHFW
jgi:uncharacterized membrane protein YphA (DoxX/SURF4 family)